MNLIGTTFDSRFKFERLGYFVADRVDHVQGSKRVKGKFKQPNPELAVRNFAVSLHARASAFAQVRG